VSFISKLPTSVHTISVLSEYMCCTSLCPGEDFWGAPDLDHTNPHLREALVHWLQHLRDNIGFKGWRFDFAKVWHTWIAGELPNLRLLCAAVDGSGVKMQCAVLVPAWCDAQQVSRGQKSTSLMLVQPVFSMQLCVPDSHLMPMLDSCHLQGYGSSFIREYVHESGAGDEMNVGEFWSDMHWEDGGVLAYNQDAARQRIVNWLDGHKASAAAFDFPTKGILQVRLWAQFCSMCCMLMGCTVGLTG
jgi:hypothetical protein